MLDLDEIAVVSCSNSIEYALPLSAAFLKTSTPLLSKNRLYLWADNGVITCLRPQSGEKVWKARIEGVKDTFFGSPVLAGNTIFCVSAYGQVVAIADSDEFKQLGVTDLKQTCRSTPALANGDLYLRTAKRLLCVKGY